MALDQAREAKHLLGKTVCASQIRADIVAARALSRFGGREAEARRLIDQAETMFAQLPFDEVDNTALGFTERQFWFTVGNAYTNLGLHLEAAEAQRRALALYQPTEYLDPALIRLDQAACLMRTDQADSACELASQPLSVCLSGTAPALSFIVAGSSTTPCPCRHERCQPRANCTRFLRPRTILNHRVAQRTDTLDSYRDIITGLD